MLKACYTGVSLPASVFTFECLRPPLFSLILPIKLIPAQSDKEHYFSQELSLSCPTFLSEI